MTEATTPGTGDPTPDDATPPAAGDPPAGDTSGDPTPTTQPTEPLGDAGKAALDKERKARAEAEKQLRELLDWKKQQERAGLDEAERLRAEVADATAAREQAEARMRDAVLASAFQREAIAAGVNPELADLALSAIKSELDVDSDGSVIGLTAALHSLRTSRPSLFTPVTPAAPRSPGGTNPGDGQGSGGATPPPVLSEAEAAMAKSFGMTPERWVEAKKKQPDLSKLINKE